MNRDERIEALKTQIKIKEDAEAEIDRLTNGAAITAAAPVKSKKLCSICKQPDHRADGCPQRPTGAVETTHLNGGDTMAHETP